MLSKLVSFDDKPIGTASLAQVHKAVLDDGTVLAVKVQHPKVKAHSFIDMNTMEVCYLMNLNTVNLVKTEPP